MGIDVEFLFFHRFAVEISSVKGGVGVQTGGPPLEPVWRPMVTWRRVLRTISKKNHQKEHQK